MNSISNILVVGSGAMGSQIAALAAMGGFDVSLVDVQRQALAKAETDLTKRITRLGEKGKLSGDSPETVLNRLTFTTDLAEAAASADFVIEAIVEKTGPKASVFREISEFCPEHTVFASNTSSIVGSKIGELTDRPEKFCNMHFFNPPLVMDCVEIVGGPKTIEATIAAAEEVCVRMGRFAAVLDKETPGFVANRIIDAIFSEALELYEGGFASIDVIDEICRRALGHPMGPFELLDMAGIDVNYDMRNSFYEQIGDESMRPQATISRLVELNDLGRKTGRGFYTYENGQKRDVAIAAVGATQ